MSKVIDDATSAMNDAYDDASTLLDNDDVPLGELLDKQIARVIQHDVVEDSDDAGSPPKYELPVVPKGYEQRSC